MPQTILIVEDDPQIRRVVEIALQAAGYKTQIAGDGAEGLAKAKSGRFDLIILDIGLPEMDGLTVCQSLRQTDNTPIIFLTAKQDEVDRIIGLELGGDDYLGKPFSPRELVVRVKTILRRMTVKPALTQTISHGGLTFDASRHYAAFENRPLPLTAREMDILAILMAHPEQVFSKNHLVDRIYGVGFHISDRTLDSHLRNLRQKLSDIGCPDAIETLHGVGVKMGNCLGI